MLQTSREIDQVIWHYFDRVSCSIQSQYSSLFTKIENGKITHGIFALQKGFGNCVFDSLRPQPREYIL